MFAFQFYLLLLFPWRHSRLSAEKGTRSNGPAHTGVKTHTQGSARAGRRELCLRCPHGELVFSPWWQRSWIDGAPPSPVSQVPQQVPQIPSLRACQPVQWSLSTTSSNGNSKQRSLLREEQDPFQHFVVAGPCEILRKAMGCLLQIHDCKKKKTKPHATLFGVVTHPLIYSHRPPRTCAP